MKTFKSFLAETKSSPVDSGEEVVLSESLDSAVEFYMTEDTEMPKRIVGAFNINGTDYGISLEASNFQRIYIMKFYRVVGTKRRFWAFKNPADIRPALSTILKFTEASLPFIKMHFDGIIVETPGKYASQKFNKLVERMMKKSYISTFRFVPVNQAKAMSYNYVFFTRKTVQPKVLFKSAKFKAYEFDNGETMPVELAQDIVPKKMTKASVSLKPSAKHSFKNLGINAPTEEETQELLSKVVAAKPKGKAKTSGAANNPELPMKVNIDFNHMTPGQIMALALPQGVDLVIKYGFDDEKLNYDNMVYALKGADATLIAWFKDQGFFLASDKLSAKGKKYFAAGLKNVDQMDSDEHKSIKQVAKNISKDLKSNHAIDNPAPEKPAKNKLESTINPASLISTIPGAGKGTFEGYYSEKNEDITKKKNYIFNDLNYSQKLKDDLTTTQFSRMKAYTGSASGSYNFPLREVAERWIDGETKPSDAKWMGQHQKIRSLAGAFDKITPMPESIWVYRGGYVPTKYQNKLIPGEDYVDPAFLSTSIISKNSFGMSNAKFIIYVPKGSRVLPVLDHSNHPGENEIILPPMAIQRIIKVDINEHGQFYITTVLIGSAWKAFEKEMKTNKKLFEKYMIINEDKKPIPKYDPHTKFGGRIANPAFGKKISALQAKLNKKKKPIKK